MIWVFGDGLIGEHLLARDGLVALKYEEFARPVF